ncbi:MAG: DUF1559 domain-containing protein [Planctomycetaceae bacterium]|nr:DUF1559 domain-containing protein [Planctomycetaceae bacterium]
MYELARYWIAMPISLLIISTGTIARVWCLSKANRIPVHHTILVLFGFVFMWGLFGPAGIVHPRSAAMRTQCRSNLKYIGLAFHNYHDDWKTFPPAALKPQSMSWRIALLPHLDEKTIAALYDFHEPWNSVTNLRLQQTKINDYSCPARPKQSDSHGNYYTSCLVPTGDRTIFNNARGTPLSAIKDGTSNTLLAIEACGTKIIWTEPREVDFVVNQVSINGPGATKGESDSMFSSWHYGGVQVVLADGSARFLQKVINPSILRSLLTKDANGNASGDW